MTPQEPFDWSPQLVYVIGARPILKSPVGRKGSHCRRNKISVFNNFFFFTTKSRPERGMRLESCIGRVQSWLRAASVTSFSCSLGTRRSSCLKSSEGPWTCSRGGPGSRRSALSLPLSRNKDQLEGTVGPPHSRENPGLSDQLPGFRAALPVGYVISVYALESGVDNSPFHSV